MVRVQFNGFVSVKLMFIIGVESAMKLSSSGVRVEKSTDDGFDESIVQFLLAVEFTLLFVS